MIARLSPMVGRDRLAIISLTLRFLSAAVMDRQGRETGAVVRRSGR